MDSVGRMGDGMRPGIERVGTGNPQLDAILRGGFPAHSINVIMGQPGTGKTILAEQLLFHNAGGERPVVYFSTLSEPLAKVITYLQHFTFYDEAKMLDSVIYEELGPGILEGGGQHVLERVREVIRGVGPSILVIDSFKAIHDLAGSAPEMRRLTAELGGALAAYDVTTFLVGEYGIEDVPVYPEFAVADGVVQLARVDSGKRDNRFLRVLKLRGSAYAEGLHAFTITGEGLKVFPRLVTPQSPPAYEVVGERVPTGTTGLDTMLGGGFWRGSASLVLGPAGAGKTTLGLSFVLEGVRRGEPSLFMNFQENPSQLARTIQSLGVDLEEQRERGLHLLYRSPVELQIDAIVVDLFRMVREQGIRRVVIDALGDLALAAASRERFHDYLYSIVQHLAVNGVTSVLTLEGRADVGRLEGPQEARFSSMSDVMIGLDIDASAHPPRRRLRVVKARGMHHPLEARAFRIEAGGIRLDGEEPS